MAGHLHCGRITRKSNMSSVEIRHRRPSSAILSNANSHNLSPCDPPYYFSPIWFSFLQANVTPIPSFTKHESVFMFECPCILDKQIKVRSTRSNQWWFIGNQLFLNMFRASLRPSSGEQTASHCLWCSILAVAVVVPESWVARCVHCEKFVAWLQSSNIKHIKRTSHNWANEALRLCSGA